MILFNSCIGVGTIFYKIGQQIDKFDLIKNKTISINWDGSRIYHGYAYYRQGRNAKFAI